MGSTSACMLLAALVSSVGALAPRIVAPAKRRVVRSMASTGLTDHEKFLFDLNGYLVVRGALSADEISELNSATDAHSHEAISRDATALKNAKRAGCFGAKGSRRDLGGMLNWEQDGFRNLLAHPKLAPYCDALLGPGYRLDHQPMVLQQDAGSEGFSLHGGPLKGDHDLNPELQYRCVNGKPWNTSWPWRRTSSTRPRARAVFVLSKVRTRPISSCRPSGVLD